MPPLCLLLLLSSCALGGASDVHWNYAARGDSGPAHWPRLVPACGGASQSPVNLTATKAATYSPLKLKHYSTIPEQAHLTNNGHTAKLSTHFLTQELTPSMQGGGLSTHYTLAQVHFHWGSTDGQGSEHQVMGQSFPMEMHLVHYKTSLGSIAGALEEGAEDSLAVLGVFFQVGGQSNPGLAQLLPRLSEIQSSGSKLLDAPLLPLSSLLDTADTTSFYRYQGSLTTPTCNEVVQWTVLKKPISISKEQMTAFRALKDSHQKPLVDNFRPVQKVGAREIVSVTTLQAGSGAQTSSAPLILLPFLFCLSLHN